MSLPPVPPVEIILRRLPSIFPEGTEHRNYVIREMAAKTIFVMFYTAAIHGSDRWIRPSQVTAMSDEQSLLTDEISRIEWTKASLSQSKNRPINCWYADNSREPIRDETIRSGLIPCRAVIERTGIPTTSSHPKYALSPEFASLFNPELTDDNLNETIELWRSSHLNKAALSRIKILKANATASNDNVEVIFPGGTKRILSAGKSSLIAKAVIEVFAPKFLKTPNVLWLSESGNKVVTQDDALAKSLGLTIDPKKALPDMILVDLGIEPNGSDLLVLFIEIVATDGPITRDRKKVLTSLALDAGFGMDSLAFLTTFSDRSAAPFRKSIADLAWGSYAWFASEPEHIIDLKDGQPSKLARW